MKKTTIFVVSHKKLKQEYYKNRKIIYVGPKEDEFASSLDYKDNTLDNISSKNPIFCELTAIYWIYKNYKEDENIVIEHYRRHFGLFNLFTSPKKFSKWLSKYDFVVMKEFLFKENMKDQFVKTHGIDMYNALKNAIKKVEPDYLTSFDSVMSSHHLARCNMYGCNKENFDKYANFLFNVLNEVERNIEIPKDTYQARIIGFMAERLLSVYLKKNNLKVKHAFVYFTKNYLK